MRTVTEESGLVSGRAIQLVYVDENGKLKTDPEAIGALKKLKGPVAVVSLFGKALNGKSFVWNQLLSRSIGFEVQTLHRPCTGDIWMWIEPVKRISEDGTEYNLVLLDVEGADSNGVLATRNSQIFALAILLSSVFIYGRTLGVNDISHDLSRLLVISEHNHVGEAMENTFSELGKFSPMFVQLMTDVDSGTVEGEQDATQNNKLEKLRPQLLYGIDALMKFVSERVRPKKRGDTIVTGPPLAGFTKSFSENINNNSVPKISSLWLSVEELEGRRARDTATEVYMSSLEHSGTLEESMLIEAHDKAVVKALAAFCEPSIGNTEVKQKYKRDLWNFFAKAFEDHKRVGYTEAYSRCCNAIEDMGKKLWALPCSHDANIGDMIKALDTAVAEYEESINGPMKWQTLSPFSRKSIQDILVHRRGDQMDDLLFENSKLKLEHCSMDNTMGLLKKQLGGMSGVHETIPDADEPTPTRTRSTKWTSKQNLVLLSGWIKYKTDSVVGRNQKGESYWGKIAEYCNEHCSFDPPRDRNSCRNHYNYVNKSLSKWVDAYNNAKRMQQSGWSKDDVLAKTYELFSSAGNGTFKYMKEWLAVCDQPRYASQIEGNTGSGNSGSKRAHENDVSDSNSIGYITRPIGWDAVKKKAKKKGKAAVLEALNEEWSEFRQCKAQELERLEKIAMMQNEANRLMHEKTQAEKMKMWIKLSEKEHLDEKSKELFQKLSKDIFGK